MTDQELFGGLIRLHLLHHAADGPLYGLSIVEELARHGNRLSPGTRYRSCTGSRRRDTSALPRAARGERSMATHLAGARFVAAAA
jgi:PadR family transcriptional regulator PadR